MRTCTAALCTISGACTSPRCPPPPNTLNPARRLRYKGRLGSAPQMHTPLDAGTHTNSNTAKKASPPPPSLPAPTPISQPPPSANPRRQASASCVFAPPPRFPPLPSKATRRMVAGGFRFPLDVGAFCPPSAPPLSPPPSLAACLAHADTVSLPFGSCLRCGLMHAPLRMLAPPSHPLLVALPAGNIAPAGVRPGCAHCLRVHSVPHNDVPRADVRPRVSASRARWAAGCLARPAGVEEGASNWPPSPANSSDHPMERLCVHCGRRPPPSPHTRTRLPCKHSNSGCRTRRSLHPCWAPGRPAPDPLAPHSPSACPALRTSRVAFYDDESQAAQVAQRHDNTFKSYFQARIRDHKVGVFQNWVSGATLRWRVWCTRMGMVMAAGGDLLCTSSN